MDHMHVANTTGWVLYVKPARIDKHFSHLLNGNPTKMNGNDHQVGRFSCQEIFSKGPTDGDGIHVPLQTSSRTIAVSTGNDPSPPTPLMGGRVPLILPKTIKIPNNHFARMKSSGTCFSFLLLIVLCFWVV